jgi:toxin ParE1/3/4
MAKLIWTKNSKIDLKDIHFYISKDSKYYANSFVNKINASAKKLKHFPKLGRVVPEYNMLHLRELIIHNYRIVYKLISHTVYIVTVVHCSKDFINIDLNDWDKI